MPIYEYRCRDCSHQFETLVTGSHEPACPSCGKASLERLLSVFAVSRGGATGSRERVADGSCSTCGDPRGPGSCASGWED
jgi:putative FmdB family regulatory protein